MHFSCSCGKLSACQTFIKRIYDDGLPDTSEMELINQAHVVIVDVGVRRVGNIVVVGGSLSFPGSCPGLALDASNIHTNQLY